MRWLVIIVVAAMAFPSGAAEKMTVSQLEQILGEHSSKKPQPNHDSSPSEAGATTSDNDLLQQIDGEDELVRRIAGMELGERLSTTTMYRLVWKYHLGPHLQQALEELSDRTALLNLPDKELPALSPPDAASQQAMWQAARVYVIRELSHLPNFMATETTTRFDDSPPALKYWQAMTDGAGFHRAGLVQQQITFQDGKEVTVEAQRAGESKVTGNALESRGEFGTEAAVVLMDLERGNFVFSNWERTLAGMAAVFQYSVPRESSHYEVKDECRGRGSFHNTPAYHGTLALDPKTGAIFRMTLEAESNAGDPVSHVASVVEYGPVVLGHRRSICPLRSLTFMVKETNGCSQGSHKLEKPVAMMNQTIFSNYHRFGSNSTIVLDEAAGSPNATGTSPVEPESGGENGSRMNSLKPAGTGQNKHP